MADPEMPDFLPRLGDDSPEDRPQRKWEELFYPQRAPEMPEAYRLQLAEFDRLDAYMRRVSPEDIRYDDALRQREAARVKIMALVDVAKKDRGNGLSPEDKAIAEADEEERYQRRKKALDAEQEAKVAAARERARKRREAEELSQAGREGTEAEETEQDRAAARIGAAFREEVKKHSGEVVSLKPRREEKTKEETDLGDGPQRIDIRRWSSRPEPLKWIVPGFVRPGVATLFSGRGGAGKGIVSMTLATAMMPGQGRKGFMGASVDEGPVFGLFCEDEEQVLQIRQHPIDTYYDIPHGMYWQERAYYSLVGQFSALAVVEKGTNRLLRTPLWKWLLDQVGLFPRRLTILDPVSRLFIGDLNDPLQAVQFSAMLEELARVSGGAVLANFHPSRSALKDVGMSDGVGHSPQWVNAFRVAAFLDVPYPEEDPDLRVLKTTKVNDGSRNEVRLRWEGGLFAPERSGGPRPGVRYREQFLELFDRAWGRGVYVSDSHTSRDWAPKKLLSVGGLDPEDRALLAGMKAAMMALVGEGVLVVGSYRHEVQRKMRERLERASTGASTGA